MGHRHPRGPAWAGPSAASHGGGVGVGAAGGGWRQWPGVAAVTRWRSRVPREDWKPVLTINSIIYGLQYLFLVSGPRAGTPGGPWETPRWHLVALGHVLGAPGGTGDPKVAPGGLGRPWGGSWWHLRVQGELWGVSGQLLGGTGGH